MSQDTGRPEPNIKGCKSNSILLDIQYIKETFFIFGDQLIQAVIFARVFESMLFYLYWQPGSHGPLHVDINHILLCKNETLQLCVFAVLPFVVHPQQVWSEDNGDVSRCHFVHILMFSQFGEKFDQIPIGTKYQIPQFRSVLLNRFKIQSNYVPG